MTNNKIKKVVLKLIDIISNLMLVQNKEILAKSPITTAIRKAMFLEIV